MTMSYCWFCEEEYHISKLFEICCHLEDNRKKPTDGSIKICTKCMKPQLKLMGYKLVKIKNE